MKTELIPFTPELIPDTVGSVRTLHTLHDAVLDCHGFIIGKVADIYVRH